MNKKQLILKNGNYALLEFHDEWAIEKDKYRLVFINDKSIKDIEEFKENGICKVLRVLTKKQYESLIGNVVIK